MLHVSASSKLANMLSERDGLEVRYHLSKGAMVVSCYNSVPGAKETPSEGTEERFSDSTYDHSL